MTDLTTTDESTAMQALPPSASPMEVLVQNVITAGIDSDAFKTFMEMASEREDREAKRAYAAAMSRVQSQVAPVYKSAYNEQTRTYYAPLEQMHSDLYPVYSAEGFSLSYGEADCPKEGWHRIICDVFHLAGHTRQYRVDLPIDNVGIKGNVNKTTLHGVISTMSYGQRVLEGKIFAVAFTDQDNDGQTVEEAITDKQAADLEALCEEVGADRVRFLKWLAVDSFESLPTAKHDQAVKGLEAKRAKA